ALETGTSAVNGAGSSAASTQKKTERPRANSSGSVDASRLTGGPVGFSVASSGKPTLQIPVGPQCRSRGHSAGYLRREVQGHSSPEDIVVKVDKEVCRQMDSVFVELLSRQALQDPSSSAASSPSAQGSQKKGKRDGCR
uniref:Uncharacterized protein n=2 Tax=Gasterosteus aculeatus TaxID=69293 RepID=G3P1F6_GASAC